MGLGAKIRLIMADRYSRPKTADTVCALIGPTMGTPFSMIGIKSKRGVGKQ